MAEGSRLVLTFVNSSGNDVVMTFDYADPSISNSAVKNLMNTIITNGSIYDNVPVTAKSAKMVITSETEYNISD